jgi:hypothetical protein
MHCHLTTESKFAIVGSLEYYVALSDPQITFRVDYRVVPSNPEMTQQHAKLAIFEVPVLRSGKAVCADVALEIASQYPMNQMI